MNPRVALLSAFLLVAPASPAQDLVCQCSQVFNPLGLTEKLIDSLYLRYDLRCQNLLQDRSILNLIRISIDEVDQHVNTHHEKYVEFQLRGRKDKIEFQKCLLAEAHARFLCGLDWRSHQLKKNLDAFSDVRLPSLKPVFQAYVSSVKNYHNQSRNLVDWQDLKWKRTAEGKNPIPMWYAPIHEGNIIDYNLAYQFMELCKNNLLKEFSILDLSQRADKLQTHVGTLQDSLNSLRKSVDALTFKLNKYLDHQETEGKQIEQRLTHAELELKVLDVWVQASPKRRKWWSRNKKISPPQ